MMELEDFPSILTTPKKTTKKIVPSQTLNHKKAKKTKQVVEAKQEVLQVQREMTLEETFCINDPILTEMIRSEREGTGLNWGDLTFRPEYTVRQRTPEKQAMIDAILLEIAQEERKKQQEELENKRRIVEQDPIICGWRGNWDRIAVHDYSDSSYYYKKQADIAAGIIKPEDSW